jgi:hypothetical protein
MQMWHILGHLGKKIPPDPFLVNNEIKIFNHHHTTKGGQHVVIHRFVFVILRAYAAGGGIFSCCPNPAKALSAGMQFVQYMVISVLQHLHGRLQHDLVKRALLLWSRDRANGSSMYTGPDLGLSSINRWHDCVLHRSSGEVERAVAGKAW